MSPIAVAPPYLPTSELVGVAWLSQRVAGLDGSMVATTLPSMVSKWSGSGFLQAQALVAGSSDIDLPQARKTLLQLDAWAVNVDASGAVSAKPAWNEANRLIELVRAATEEQDYGKPVELPAAYLGARVQSVYFVTEPARVLNDPSGYARFTVDLALDWVRA